jgi:predicted secreted protein
VSQTGRRTSVVSRKKTIVLTACVLALMALAMLLAGCSRNETTTTTAGRQFGERLQVIKLNELSNGKVVSVSPGFLIQLELKGQPSLRYHWDVLPPDPKIVWSLPGPRVLFDEMNLQGTFTFDALAVGVGQTDFSADYVNRMGEVQRSFKCTFNVVSSLPTTTTATEATTTTASSTTTTASSTTTTQASTTTTAKPTTTTAGSSTTTTTEKPTTTTTEKPTTTTVTLPPTTSTSYIPRPPTTEVPGNTYLDERNNGDVVNAVAGSQIVLTLGGNPSTGYQWKIEKIDQAVLRSQGDPQFTPSSDLPGAPGVYTWTFDVLQADASTALALVYLAPDGTTIDQYFYVGIVTTSVQVTPY